jgi:hypothetical protein
MSLFLALAAAVHGQRLDLSYGYPFYSPLARSDDPAVEWKESRGSLSAGYRFEPAAILATGPRCGWSFWDSRPRGTDYDLGVRKWEIGWSVMPQKRLTGNARLFLDASIGFEYLDYTARFPVADSLGIPPWEKTLSKSEWGFGRSLGMGLEFGWIQMSVHHDAFLAKSLLREFAGLRASLGLVLRKRP